MAPKVKEAMSVLSDALETACGWAFCAIALYALLFVNLTGNGTLWDSIRGVVLDSRPVPIPRDAAVQMRVVPVRPVDEMAKAQNRMLLIPDEPEKEFKVPVLAALPASRPADQLTDAPTDGKTGTDWRKHLSGSLRTFTVYGEGDEHSSASTSAGTSARSSGPSAVQAAAVAPTPSTPSSAYRAGITAEARPGVTDHVSQVDAGSADGLNNFR